MSSQPSLFDHARRPRSASERREQAARAFRAARPDVWAAFCDRARELYLTHGFERYSAKGVFEQVRWTLIKAGDTARLNNNHVACWARWAMVEGHVPQGFFQTRER